jgi:poly(3-hydroxybutyrate) depolymerase
VGTGGTGGAGGTAGSAGTGGTGGAGGQAPVIPPINGACPAFVTGTVEVGGLAAIQFVAGPKAAGRTAPLVFYWHAEGSPPSEFNSLVPAMRDGVVAAGGVLVSFPHTLGGDPTGIQIWGAGDFPVMDQIVACAVANHNVDPRRIFTTGCSSGGMFAAALAASRSNYIAAAASNSGGWWAPDVPFQNGYTPALMTIHGDPYYDSIGGGAVAYNSARANQAFKARGGFVISCSHTGGKCQGAARDSSVWEFFRAHPYGVAPDPWSSLPSGFHSSCTIF